jgi:hypothetical protein
VCEILPVSVTLWAFASRRNGTARPSGRQKGGLQPELTWMVTILWAARKPERETWMRAPQNSASDCDHCRANRVSKRVYFEVECDNE